MPPLNHVPSFGFTSNGNVELLSKHLLKFLHMVNISVAEILRMHGKWIQAKNLVTLVREKLDITERHAYVLIKKALTKDEILREKLQSNVVLYGLAEFGPPAVNGRNGGVRTAQHSKIAIRRVEPYLEHPYRLLMLFESGELDVLCPEFAGHLTSGYPNLYALFEKFRNLPESLKVTIVDEDEGWTTGEDETSPTEDIVNEIVNEVYRKLKHIVTQVENGRKLRGECEYCSG